MKRLVALIIVLAMSLGLVGCVPKAPPAGDGDDVVININISDLGYGTQWLYASKARFEELYEDKEYADGKYTGVFLRINPTGTTDSVKNFGNSGNHIVFGGGLVKSEANYNTLLNLTADGFDGRTLGEDTVVEKEEYGLNIYEDIYNNTGVNAGIESIYDLIKEDDKANYFANDGEVYSLPTFEVFAGGSYDKHLFDTYGFYFADTTETEDVIELACPLLSNTDQYGVVDEKYDNNVYYLVDIDNDDDWEEHLSVGPDGVEGTLDDGLPSSLFEFIALCWWMKTGSGEDVYPLQLSGTYTNIQGDVFIQGLVYSLLGQEKALTTRNFEGPVDAVVGFTGMQQNDPEDPKMSLSPRLNYIRQPITQRVNISEETGFYTQWAVERYYSMALMEIFMKEGWLAPGSDPIVGSVDHLESENRFVFSDYKKPGGGRGDKIAFLSESSYWYNEASIRGSLPNFYNYNDDVEEREVRWYSYPSNIAVSVTGENKTETVNGITESAQGKQNVIASSKLSQIVFNKVAIQKNKDGAVLEAIKDFIEFWYSEEELIATTLSQGMGRNMNFVMPEESKTEWAGFYRHLNDLKDESYVLPMSGNNDTMMLGCYSVFKLGEGGAYFSCHSQFTDDLLRKVHLTKKGFTDAMWGPANWKKYYKGDNIGGVDYIKDGSGNPIVYNAPWDDAVA